MCSTMCSFGWSPGNQKVPQCPEKLGAWVQLNFMVLLYYDLDDGFDGAVC